jgi:NAD(P) transhydrogenase
MGGGILALAVFLSIQPAYAMQVIPKLEYVAMGYIVATFLFILSLKGLKTEATATGGTICGMLGMSVMMLVVLISAYVTDEAYWILGITIILPSIAGVIYAYKVITDKLPELVGLFNSFGGLAAAIEGIGVYTDKTAEWSVYNGRPLTDMEKYIQLIIAYISIFVGSVTFTGSVVAVLKLRGTLASKPTFMFGDSPNGRIAHKAMQFFILFLCLACCVACTWIGYPFQPYPSQPFAEDSSDRVLKDFGGLGIFSCVAIALLSGIIGILQTLVVSGADMAVVICVLNSGSGWSGVAAGFMMSHELLLVTGAFVGASGAILSILMCKAMNCPMMRVLGFSPPPPEKKGEEAKELPWTPITTPEVKELLMQANSIIIAPGYGMAVGKAQGEVAELVRTLRAMKKTVRFCIHPVAGRLPGHMNILLAEAQVPYDWVNSMEEINKDFEKTDVAMCIGAWDTVNPAAAENPDCPVYGMPMCRVWDAKTCIVNKRSMGKATGFSGAQNMLPHKECSKMWLGNAKSQAADLNAELKKELVGVDDKSKAGVEPPARKDEDCDLKKMISKLQQQLAKTDDKKRPAIQKQLECATDGKGKSIGVPRETSDVNGEIALECPETRCALTPKSALDLRAKYGFTVIAERGVGKLSGFADRDYEKAGVTLTDNIADIYQADVVMKLNPPVSRDGRHELERMRPNTTFIGYVGALVGGRASETPDAPKSTAMKDVVIRAARCKINLLNMAMLPRISRAQKSDALSVFGKLAGNRAALEGAVAYGRITPGEITSAGKNPQAKAWVGGCGVAGLEAVAMLKKLGCDCYATDVRYVEDQVLSVGGTFVHYDLIKLREAAGGSGGSQAYAGVQGAEAMRLGNEMYMQWAPTMDIMILTAAIPGAPPVKLMSKAVVMAMKPGSVIVDIAASARFAKLYKEGDEKSPWPGNCELTVPGQKVTTSNGVHIVGFTDLPARFAQQATDFYANCLVNLVEDMCFQGTLKQRGTAKPVVGTAEDFKVDMTVIREQVKPDGSDGSYYSGAYAVGDDVMAGMTVVKVEQAGAHDDFEEPTLPERQNSSNSLSGAGTSPDDVSVTFQPAELGMKAVWTTGVVTEVAHGGQAQHHNVQEGWTMKKIIHEGHEQAYTEKVLEETIAQGRPYNVVFGRASGISGSKSPSSSTSRAILAGSGVFGCSGASGVRASSPRTSSGKKSIEELGGGKGNEAPPTATKVGGPTKLKALIDYPKPPPKPMMTNAAIFENQMKTKSTKELEAELKKQTGERDNAFQFIKSTYGMTDPDAIYQVISMCRSSQEKINAIKAMERAKDLDGYVNCLPKLIEKAKEEDRKNAPVEEKNPLFDYIVYGIGAATSLACVLLMAFGPAPGQFIGNVMIFLLASFLGYHLVVEVKPSLYTPLMSMSNAISGIVIVGGMLQIQGKYLWHQMGTGTQILGAVAVAVAAVNIAGGFAVTFRMLSMFKKA